MVLAFNFPQHLEIPHWSTVGAPGPTSPSVTGADNSGKYYVAAGGGGGGGPGSPSGPG